VEAHRAEAQVARLAAASEDVTTTAPRAAVVSGTLPDSYCYVYRMLTSHSGGRGGGIGYGGGGGFDGGAPNGYGGAPPNGDSGYKRGPPATRSGRGTRRRRRVGLPGTGGVSQGTSGLLSVSLAVVCRAAAVRVSMHILYELLTRSLHAHSSISIALSQDPHSGDACVRAP
jgi:hypothetical protein